MTSLYECFAGGLPPRWRTLTPGEGEVVTGEEGLALVNGAGAAGRYTNAQIDDYQGLPRRDFLWRPPLRLTLRARFSHPGAHEAGAETPLTGTAGFGFWNDPFLMTGLRVPTLPRALWFFYASPPANMALALDVPGWGWKAATIDALSWSTVALALTMPIAVPLMNLPPVYRRLWPLGQRAMAVAERWVPGSMVDWHIYSVDWRARCVRFYLDGKLLLATARAPRGPLGLVIWLDNQFLQVTPGGRFGYGWLARPVSQWLTVDWLALEPGAE